jgi:capsule polysaccharide export protein KpsE/RkpR
LNFSSAQTEQFTILLTQFQTDITALQQQIAPRQQQLDLLLSQTNPNPAQIGVLVVQIHALQQQAAQVLQGYQTAFAGLLTPPQQQQVALVTAASQVQPAVGAFVALQLVPPPPPLPWQKP